jgi:hypothetical protein
VIVRVIRMLVAALLGHKGEFLGWLLLWRVTRLGIRA